MIASRIVGSDSAAFTAAVAWMAAVYIIGVGHGLWLAWTQPARMSHWAKRVQRAQEKLNELEDKADGIPTDRELRRLRRVAYGKASSSEPARGAGRGNSDVHAEPTEAVLGPVEGSSAVNKNGGPAADAGDVVSVPVAQRARRLAGAAGSMLPEQALTAALAIGVAYAAGRLVWLTRWEL